jgi:osmotically-inducible protein OsmY
MKGSFLTGTAVGATLAYLFDPSSGRRRRSIGRDRTRALFRRGTRRGESAGRAVASEAYGISQKAKHLREELKEFDDATLAQKVMSEVFREKDLPKGDVSINAAEGVVSLRGEVRSPEIIEELVARTRQVQGVREVENLLHLPNTESPKRK